MYPFALPWSSRTDGHFARATFPVDGHFPRWTDFLYPPLDEHHRSNSNRYGIEIYGQASKTHIDRVQKVQNKIITILFKNKNTCTTSDIFKKHKILNIRKLRDFIIITKNYFDNTYKITSNTKAKILRETTYRHEVPSIRNDYGKQSRTYYIPKVFNKLPTNLININGIKKSKIEVKKFLLENELNKRL